MLLFSVQQVIEFEEFEEATLSRTVNLSSSKISPENMQ